MGAVLTKLPTSVATISASAAAPSSKDSLLVLIDDIRTFAIKGSIEDSAGHAELLSKISTLNLAAETSIETIYRIGHQSWQNAAIRIAIDMSIFDAIVQAAPDSISAEELASKRGADPILVARIMRVLTAIGLCAEAGVAAYTANSKTKIMTLPQGITSFKTWIDISMPTAAKVPAYLRSNDYQNPRDTHTSPFAYTFGSEFWTWLEKHPEHAATFSGFMASRRQGRPYWYDYYPIEEELSSLASADAVTLIEIGGNKGHDLISLKASHPNLQGKLFLQDLPDVVADVTFADKDMSVMGHNFFNPQPIKHALAYHFRAIFHDWADAECLQILTHTAAAMQPGFSKLLISEFVLTDTNTALFPASLDLQMMGLHAGMERSEGQWRTLLDKAGLEVVRIWRRVVGGESVIEAHLR